MKRLTELHLVLVLILNLCACGQSAPTWQEQYDLGIRYLSEGNYEEAIIAFSAAIEIDPKQAPAYVGRGDAYVASGETEAFLATALADYEIAIELDATLPEAYIGLANLYIHNGETEKALEILTTALEKMPNSNTIQSKIGEIERNMEAKVSTFFENPVSWDEIVIGGFPFNECTPELLAQVYDGFSFSDEIGNMYSTYDGLNFTYAEENGYRQAVYVGSAPLEFRGLFCGQDEAVALHLLGLTESGITYVKSAERTRFSIRNRECISASTHSDDSSPTDADEFSIELGFVSENSGYIHIWFKEGKLDSVFIDSHAT